MRRALLSWGPTHQLAVSGTGQLVAGSGCIVYSSAWETTGSNPAFVSFHDGASANGQIWGAYALTAGQSTSEDFGLHWLPFHEGIYVHTESGTAAGSITAYLDHSCDNWLNLEHRALLFAIGADLAEMGIGG